MRRVLHLSWLLLIIGVVVGYSLYLDNAGIVTTGRVSAKHETISVHSGDWNRHFELQARFQVPGEAVPRYAQGNVDTLTYDRARIGDSVPVRYLPSPVLHQIVLIPTARLASDTTFSFPGDWGPIERGALVIFLLVVLLMVAVKGNSRIAGVLFIVLGTLAFGYFLFPREMTAPAGNTQSAHATVTHISTVNRILEGRRKRGITISQPYDIVQLSFIPQGRSEPVIAVDEIDHDSIPELSAGAVLPIQYQLDQPRTARILDGSRTFPEKARLSFAVNTGSMFLFLWLVYWLRGWIRAKATRMLGKVQTAAFEARQSNEATPKPPGRE
jgi:hypothetical protein